MDGVRGEFEITANEDEVEERSRVGMGTLVPFRT
jgi:hypothetical protein